MEKEMKIKTMLGIGDAVYTYPLVKYFSQKQSVKVITPYPEIFKCLNAETSSDMREAADLTPRYTHSRSSEFSQYEDLLRSVNLSFIPFEWEWQEQFSEHFKRNYPVFLALIQGKKICVIKEPCCAHMNKGAKDFSIVPNVSEMQDWVNANKEKYFFVSVGYREIFHSRLEGIDLDLNDKINLTDLLTLCKNAGAIASQVGHLIPIAQGLNIPLKIFYPENPTHHALKFISPKKMQIPGVNNEII